MAKQSLLLVDGDVKSLRVLEVSLKKAGYNVTTAVTGVDALEKVQTAQPDLIISDTEMQEMNGFDLCRRLQDNPDWSRIPFIFLTGQTSIEHKIKGLELGVEEYLTKPIYIKEILTRIKILLQKTQRVTLEQKRDGRTRFQGLLSDMGVVDLIQTIDLSRKSGLVHVTNDEAAKGTLFFRDGKVIDAELGTLKGEDAVYRMLTWGDGEFEFVFRSVRRKDVIEMSSQGLLMEGMRRLDEWGRLLEQLPSLDSRFQVDYDELSERLAEIPDELNAILKLFDGRRSLMQVIDACELGDLESLAVISKLYFEGLCVESEVPAGKFDDETDADPSAQGWLGRTHPMPAVAPPPGNGEAAAGTPAAEAAVATTEELREEGARRDTPIEVPPVGLPAIAEGEGYTEHALDAQDIAEIDAGWDDDDAAPIPASPEQSPSDGVPRATDVEQTPPEPLGRRTTLRGMQHPSRKTEPAMGAQSAPPADKEWDDAANDPTPLPNPVPGSMLDDSGKHAAVDGNRDSDSARRMISSEGADIHSVSGEVAVQGDPRKGPDKRSPARELVTIAPKKKARAMSDRKSAVMQAIDAVDLEPVVPEIERGPPPAPKSKHRDVVDALGDTATAAPAVDDLEVDVNETTADIEPPRSGGFPLMPVAAAAAVLLVAGGAYMLVRGGGGDDALVVDDTADAGAVAVAPPDAAVVAAAPPDAGTVAAAPPDAAPKIVKTPPDAAPKVVRAPRADAAPKTVRAPSAGQAYTDARRLYQRKKYDEAITRIDDAIALDADNSRYHDLKANILLGQRRYTAAKEAADAAVEHGPKRARHWLTKGMIHYELEEYPEARKAFEQYLDLDPISSRADDIRDLLDSM